MHVKTAFQIIVKYCTYISLTCVENILLLVSRAFIYQCYRFWFQQTRTDAFELGNTPKKKKRKKEKKNISPTRFLNKEFGVWVAEWYRYWTWNEEVVDFNLHLEYYSLDSPSNGSVSSFRVEQPQMPSAGWPQEVTVWSHVTSSSQMQWSGFLL